MATLAQIVKTPLSGDELAHYKQVLEGMRQEELKLLEARKSQSHQVNGAYLAENERMKGGGEGRGSAARNLSIDLSVARNVEQTTRSNLQQIDDAIKRIGQRVYGICLDCVEPIPKARLDAMPQAGKCTACLAESNGK